jgi:phosphoenolpyruvate carboxykinase (ATP)
MDIPMSCPAVPDHVLLPWATWTSREAYDKKATELARLFSENFAQYAAGVDEKIRQAAPVING